MAAKRLKLSETDLRLIARWVTSCAARVLPLFEAAAPADTRPRDALAGSRAFVRGGKRTRQLRLVALAALAAAREVRDPVASAAARAAGYAAASAYTHPLASPHQIKHILGPVVYAALARELAADDDAAVGNKELQSALRRATPALRRVVRRFPSRRSGRSRLDQLYSQLDTSLRRR